MSCVSTHQVERKAWDLFLSQVLLIEEVYLSEQNTQMFTAVQFTIAKCWKQSRCPSVSEWINKRGYIYMMEHCTAEGKKELLTFTTARMYLKSTMLSEISQG